MSRVSDESARAALTELKTALDFASNPSDQAAQDIQRDSAPPPRPRQKRRRKKKGASDMSDESNFMGASGITGMAGAAALAGLDFAMQRPDVAQRMSDGISAKAHSAVGWFQRKIQGHAQAPVGETGEGGTGEDGATPTGDSPAVTLEQAIERAGTKEGNTGFKAAVGAIEMANLVKSIA